MHAANSRWQGIKRLEPAFAPFSEDDADLVARTPIEAVKPLQGRIPRSKDQGRCIMGLDPCRVALRIGAWVVLGFHAVEQGTAPQSDITSTENLVPADLLKHEQPELSLPVWINALA